MEVQLRESEKNYRALFESIRDAIVVADKQRNIIQCNSAFHELFGYDNNDILGNQTLMLYESVEQFNKLGEAIKSRIEKPEPFTYVVKYKKKNGEIFDGETGISYLNNSSGEVLGFIETIRDVSEKIKQEIQIKQFLEVIKQTPTCIIITDIDGIIEYVNPYFEKLTGYTFNEAKGKTPRILKSGEQTETFYENLWKTISSGKVWRGEFKDKKKDGSLYWENAVISSIKNDRNEILNYVGIKEDITERKLTEQKIREYQEHLEELVEERSSKLKISEEKFRTLAENSDDTIMRFDKSYRHLYANPVIAKQTGIEMGKFIGKTHEELGFPNNLCRIWKRAIKKVFDTKSKNRIEFQLPNKIWIDWELLPEFDEKGQVNSIITFGRDITEIKNLWKELNTALNKEKEVNKLKTQFISTVSHEFRTPLTSIFSSIDLLDMFGDKWTKEKRKMQFDQMRNSIHRLTTMLDDVLKISRIERGKLLLNNINLNLLDLIKSILKEAKPLLTPKHKILQNINLVQKKYYLDEEIIRTVLLNLLSNAIKYSPKGGSIELNVKEEKNNLLIIVSDEGIGMSEKDLKNIFSEFYRANKTAYIQGTGLGLSIAKSLITKLNGEINVSSELGKGTKFTVTIPIKA